MLNEKSVIPFVILKWMVGVLIVKVTISVVMLYPGYFSPDFEMDFLLGRQSYFWGSYSWSFYVHLISGPPTLIVGMLLLSDRFRKFRPGWHRMLGRFQIANVLFFLVPSGIGMAFYAMTGPVAGAGFVLLSIATAAVAFLGWKRAVQKKFKSHRQWMMRLYVLLCSAVVIRVIGGMTTVLQYSEQWVYMMSAWLSWLAPLAILEFYFRHQERTPPGLTRVVKADPPQC